MVITNAKYIQEFENGNISIRATLDGAEMFVPTDTANTHYAEILKQVADGDITIAEAD